MEQFTVFRAANGWIVLEGSHDYISGTEVKHSRVFTDARKLASFISKESK